MMGRPFALPKDHPMNALGMQIAFALPLNLPLVGAAALYRPNWFYPAIMIVLGSHYLPFCLSLWNAAVLVSRRFLISAGVAHWHVHALDI